MILTADAQFARDGQLCWEQFFSRGAVDPPNQFDPALLGPDHPPANQWTLQPSHPRPLSTFAQRFAEGGLDLKGLARHFVRRLRAQEIHAAEECEQSPAARTGDRKRTA